MRRSCLAASTIIDQVPFRLSLHDQFLFESMTYTVQLCIDGVSAAIEVLEDESSTNAGVLGGVGAVPDKVSENAIKIAPLLVKEKMGGSSLLGHIAPMMLFGEGARRCAMSKDVLLPETVTEADKDRDFHILFASLSIIWLFSKYCMFKQWLVKKSKKSVEKVQDYAFEVEAKNCLSSEE
ncbi:unnamed protein product [Thlaspi arvense]|uniref:Uncharacterized protein n=1 Tax=Thlaspi arvense TaxID=13288 RepID=A0AAU9SIB2_THLAR|nr:unnamed protein product [Thlaspi arvense]